MITILATLGTFLMVFAVGSVEIADNDVDMGNDYTRSI
jgi:hypothetical protein